MKKTSIRVVLPANQKDKDLDFALRKLAKKVERAGILETCIRKARYEKPSVERFRKKRQKIKKIAKERRDKEKLYRDNYNRFVSF